MTPAAVSHQIKSLEEKLGTLLFHRLTRSLRLTEAGRQALPALTEGFTRLNDAVDQMRSYSEGGLLTISVSPSFGTMWLVPKLDRFRAMHPNIEIRLDGTDRLVDISRDETDVAVRYGLGNYEGVQVDFLFHQRNTPVCSPALLAGEFPLRTPQDLCNHTLLHVDWKDADASWHMWLLAAGVENTNPAKGPHFNQEAMAVQAALDGQGVALIGDRLIADHLRAGSLVCPFAPYVSTPLNFAYHLISPKNYTVRPKVSAFRDWLLAETQFDDKK